MKDKELKKYALMLFLLVILSLNVSGEKLTAYVSDYAELLSIEQENLLTTHIETIESGTGYEIAIVTTQTTNGDDRFWFAYELGKDNGVGKAETDNGVLILWSVEDEHGGAIATGRGAEVAITDADVNRIGMASRAYFDEGQYYEAFEYILSEIEKEVNEETFANTDGSSANPYEVKVAIAVLALFIVIIVVIISAASSNGSSDSSVRGSSIKSSSYIGNSWLSGGWSGGSSGRSSGGFGGFGGGSFGGGGGRF